MTTDLDRLIEAVEAGGHFRCSQTPLPDCINEDLFVSAYSGSLDAAVALLEALLPGWLLDHMGQARHTASGWHVRIARTANLDDTATAFDQPSAARALLLATLRAYRSTREGG